MTLIKREEMPAPTYSDMQEIRRKEEQYKNFWLITRRWKVTVSSSEHATYYHIATDVENMPDHNVVTMLPNDIIAVHIVYVHNSQLKEEYDVD